MAFSTPILFLVFNRPEHTKQVFQKIRRLQPSQLFISADGPRAHVAGEAERCDQVRAIVSQVDWECTVCTNFLPENQGCRKAVVAGISWFFQQVEAGIILEDDCLPDDSFFGYCAQMLEKYKDETSVWHISGSNPSARFCQQIPSNYVFSRFPFIWGWATWRRAWEQYDPVFTGLEASYRDVQSGFSAVSGNIMARRYLFDKFLRTRDGEIDTWDYGWFYSILKSHGLCLNPTKNLVSNIGFDQAATHTRKKMWTNYQAKATSIAETIQDPVSQFPDKVLEHLFFLDSQKSIVGLLLRQLAPTLFYKPIHEPNVPVWRNPLRVRALFTS